MKIFALFQSTWLIVQSIARASAGLPLTQLELATMTYILCAVLMYSFWWYKRFGAEDVIIVPQPEAYIDASRRERNDEITFDRFSDILIFERELESDLSDEPASSVPVWRVAFSGVATAFAAIRLAAWNWDFPSRPTKIMWRAFAVGATPAGSCMVASITFGTYGLSLVDDFIVLS
jgi:hypothetical protein